MINLKANISSVVLIFIFLSALNPAARSQDSINQLLDSAQASPQRTQEVTQSKPASKKRFHFFWQSEERERYRKELKDLRKRQRLEIEDLKKKRQTEKAEKAALEKKIAEQQTENMIIARNAISERDKEIRIIKNNDNTIEIVTNEEDPLYINKAQVLKGKTDFMKIKDVELKYKLELYNQTPKIIDFVLIVWERRIAFNDTQTLAKEMRVAKPITPYEKRVIEYNELDSRREGETYRVKIAKIVFEDGTQWKNPVVKDL